MDEDDLIIVAQQNGRTTKGDLLPSCQIRGRVASSEPGAHNHHGELLGER
jgi:hypothetical protein